MPLIKELAARHSCIQPLQLNHTYYWVCASPRNKRSSFLCELDMFWIVAQYIFLLAPPNAHPCGRVLLLVMNTEGFNRVIVEWDIWTRANQWRLVHIHVALSRIMIGSLIVPSTFHPAKSDQSRGLIPCVLYSTYTVQHYKFTSLWKAIPSTDISTGLVTGRYAHCGLLWVGYHEHEQTTRASKVSK